MKAIGLWKCVLGAGVVAALLGCGERTPLAPPHAATPRHDLSGSLLGTLSLLKCSPLPPASATQVLGPAGGVLQVGPHSLRIPAGALDSAVSITAAIPPDTVNRVHFEPHGLRFDRSVALTMSFANCEGLDSLLPRRVVYTNGQLEIITILPSLTDVFTRQVTGQLTHFSDYAIAW